MSSITGPFGHGGDDSRSVGSTRPFDDDGYLGYDPRLQSQRFDSFSNYGDSELVKESAGDSSPIFRNSSYGAEDVISTSNPAPETPSPPSINSVGAFSTEQNGNGPILPPPADMEPEEGFALREWHRENAIRLEKKEKQEKEMLKQIIEEADEYKADFYRRRKITTESSKATNREKEMQFLTSQEKFHAEAEKNYWKAIAELIPNEVPAIQKRGKKDNDKEKKPSIAVMQGPKPGKPTDLSRMRQILVKLKHNTPPHMKPKPPPVPPPPPPTPQAAASEAAKDAKAAPPAATATPLK